MASDKRLDQVKLVNSAESVLVVNGDQVEKATLAGFANSMGSSVPLQQTSEQVAITGLYARTSDGKMVELTKESVAQVMADITVGIVKKGAFGGDLDSLTEEGMYRVRDSITNNPEGVYYDAPIFVFKSLSLITQVIVIPASGGMVMRTKTNSGWSSWNRLDNFGYNTLAELSSGVAEQNRLYIGKGCAIRVELKNDFDANVVPAERGCRVRFDDNNPTGVGYELFFVRGGGLWFWNEQGGGWKEVATK